MEYGTMELGTNYFINGIEIWRLNGTYDNQPKFWNNNIGTKINDIDPKLIRINVAKINHK